MNVVVPIASVDKEFARAGYRNPRPLIEVCGAPLIEWATNCLDGLDRSLTYIFPVLREHVNKHQIDQKLHSLFDSPVETVVLENMTDGPAETVLTARDFITSTEEFVILFGDQYIDVALADLINQEEVNGVIPVFESSDPQWGYVETDDQQFVKIVAEKEPISTKAIAGLYYFSRGELYVDAAERMISNGVTTNGIYKVSPVYNELIDDGMTIRSCQVNEMIDLGTPEAVSQFEKNCLGEEK